MGQQELYDYLKKQKDWKNLNEILKGTKLESRPNCQRALNTMIKFNEVCSIIFRNGNGRLVKYYKLKK